MDSEEFLAALQSEASTFTAAVSTADGDWIIKGFIDIYKRIYTISVDTKVVSKVLELLLFPAFAKFAKTHDYNLELSSQQNFYPDLTFVDLKSGAKFAVDVKSSYRTSDTDVSGMTLGAFTGYFRNRNSSKNALYPYSQYSGHFVLGVIYSRCEGFTDERQQYALDNLEQIRSVIREFVFFAQPKWRIAGTSPGSGNTKNIGSVYKVSQLLDGTGPFSALGEEVYDDYWMYYLTGDMAQKLEVPRPYTNLKSYLAYKSRGIDVLRAHEEEIKHASEDEDVVADDAPSPMEEE